MCRPLALLFCLLCFAAFGCGDDDDEGGAGGGGSGDDQAQQSGQTGGCREVAQPEPKPDGGAEKPAKRLDPAKTYEVTLRTNCGAITIRLDQKTAPKTAASFESLVQSGFYDNTVFHRIVPGFVIQGGDPTATGSGGPGYSVRDVPPPDAVYREGVVAMAKTADEPPGTAGSQFYIVTAPDAGLPPEYGLLGRVVKGIEVAQAIDELGDPASGELGTPLQPVVIEKASVGES